MKKILDGNLMSLTSSDRSGRLKYLYAHFQSDVGKIKWEVSCTMSMKMFSVQRPQQEKKEFKIVAYATQKS